jgi:uncharacterized membrane protein YfcA
MYLTVVTTEKKVFRATLIYLLFVASVVRVVTSLGRGLLTPKVLWLSLPTLPFFLIAIFIGHLLHTKIPEKYYRYTIWTILFFSAVSIWLKS